MPNTTEIYNKLLESLPFETPRAEQLQAFEHMAPWIERCFIQQFKKPVFMGLDAPCGIGKSGLALASALAVKSLYNEEFGDTTDDEGKETAQIWVVTQNKLLQDQYQKDFSKKLFDLRGLDNYDCEHDPGKSCGQSVCGRIRAKQGEKKSPPQVCSFSCEYDEQKKAAARAPVLSLNVAKALNLLKNPQQAPPLMMIFDEGHEVEAALDNEATIQITPDDLQKLGLIFPKFFQDLGDMEAIEEGLRELLDEVVPIRNAEESAPVEIREVKRLKKAEAIVNKLSETLHALERGIEYVSCATDRLELKPLKVFKVFEHFFRFPTLFLSATLLSKKGFESITGLNEDQLDWFSCASPFPVKNRPIRYYWRIGSSPLNYNNMQNELPNVVARIDSILAKHPTERGIIHTHTYKNAERVYQDLWVKYGSRLLFPKSAREQKDALELHARSKNTVLISPSMTQGVDLRDELCRFSILMKVPWLPTNDPVVKSRMEANPDWYTYKAAMTVVQAPGRGVRSSTDFAETYLVDPGFQGFINRSRQHLPKWFLDSVLTRAVGPY